MVRDEAGRGSGKSPWSCRLAKTGSSIDRDIGLLEYAVGERFANRAMTCRVQISHEIPLDDCNIRMMLHEGYETTVTTRVRRWRGSEGGRGAVSRRTVQMAQEGQIQQRNRQC